MAVRALTVDDVDWAVATLGHRRESLVPHAPVFWAPADGAAQTHARYLRWLLTEGGVRGYRTDASVLVVARSDGRLLVDDAAWSDDDGVALWDAFAADARGEPLRVVCPRYEPDRLALVLASGLHVHETWWLRELPGSGGGTAGEDVALPGGRGRTVAAPPVYAPPGPILLVSELDDLTRAAPAAVDAAARLGCAGVVVSVPGGDLGAAEPLDAAGFRPHCDFVHGHVAPVRRAASEAPQEPALAQQQDLDGVTLARAYWQQVVRGLLDECLPGVPRAAARIGTGSEVLGLDDEMSRDHDWGLRLQLVVAPEHVGELVRLLDARLPDEFAGHPSRFCFTGTTEPRCAVDVLTVGDLVTRLGFDPRAGGTPADWLSLTGQAVLEVTAGEVFEDTAGELTALRAALAWYPDDVWRYVIASGWQRIDQEMPLMGRAADRGDDLGARVIAARLVDVAMHLGFVLCRRWAPYGKWRGTLFARLPLPAGVGGALGAALVAEDGRARAGHLSTALDALLEVQRRAGLPAPSRACVPFWDRPYLHLDPALVPGVLAEIGDPEVRTLPMGLGSVEQRSDNVDLLMRTDRRRAAVGLAPGR